MASDGGEAASGLPQFDPSSYPSQLIWLAATFGFLFLVIWKWGLPRIENILGERQAQLDDDFESAKQMHRESETLRLEYESKLNDAHKDAQEELRSALAIHSTSISEKESAAAGRIKMEAKKARVAIEAAREQAHSDISHSVSDLARSAVDQLLDRTSGTRSPLSGGGKD